MRSLLRLPLYPLSWLFQALVGLKNKLYDHGLLGIDQLDKPVISVGNLAMGGSGKSPVVGALIELLDGRGYRVAVLSRGYGREDSKASRLVDPQGDWRLFGDEPMMLARAYPQARICVGPSRYAAARVVAHDPPDVYLVDDGFQHRQLARDLDVVLLDVNQGYPRFFPVSLFREGWQALKRADLVLLTRGDATSCTPFREKIGVVKRELPVLAPQFVSGDVKRLDSGQLVLPENIPGGRVAAYAGIARPQKFFDALKSQGFEVVISKSLSDHGELGQTARNELFDACQKAGLRYLITTEKDAVKLDKRQDSAILLCSLSLTVKWREEDQLLQILDRVMKADA